jgi:hypothetical protein
LEKEAKKNKAQEKAKKFQVTKQHHMLLVVLDFFVFVSAFQNFNYCTAAVF